MKKTSILILSTLLLTACGGANDNLQGQLSLEEQNQVVDITNTLPAFSAEYQLNEEIILKALDLADPALCETITDPVQQQSCMTLINDEALMQTAIETMNLDKCEKVSTSNMQTRCEILVTSELDKNSYQEEIDAMSAQLSEIVKSGAIEDCEKLADSNFAETCRVEIKMNLASKEKDPSYCEGLKNFLHDRCLASAN